MPGGRPTKYNAKVMLPIMKKAAEDGLFIEELAKELGVSKDTIYDWSDPDSERYNKEFSDALTEVKDGRDRWLITQVRNRIVDRPEKDASANLLIFTLKNVLGWRDRQEIETNNTNRTIDIVDE